MMRRAASAWSVLLLLSTIASCSAGGGVPVFDSAVAVTAAATIDGANLMKHVGTLASDEYEGRSPGTRGEQRTLDYLMREFKRLGLEPGNPDGSWLQPVSLAAMRATPTVSFTVKGRPLPIQIPRDIIVRVVSPDSDVVVPSSDVVFVGYGIVAPEFGWDDYAGIDVRGKTVVVLPGEPTPETLRAAGRPDTTILRGREMSFHGWTRGKREQALNHGAAALIMVRREDEAGRWNSLLPIFTQEYAAVEGDVKRENPINAYMQWSALQQIFRATGRSTDSLLVDAARASFKPFATGATASFRVRLQHRTLATHNVVAKLTGSDPVLREEIVLYSSHWDAFGRDTTLTGDQIRNGAVDNAIGTAQLLEIAGAFARLPKHPARTILFVATTAEELGLLGARAYALQPLYPLSRTLADINLDSGLPWGRTTAVTNLGDGRSTLDEVVRQVARELGKTIEPDASPEEGFYFRSDHFEFARVGVPSIFVGPAGEVIGKPPGFLKQKDDEYGAKDYHTLTDEIKPGWDLSGDAELARFSFLVGLRVAQGTVWPTWKAGAEFKALRDSMVTKR
ncbi:MAG: M28 family peptidase [Gemmatimonadaceae bacterium]